MAQDEDLDLVGGVGAGVEHHPAQQLCEHLVDQLHRHRGVMPRHRRPRSMRSAAVREVSGTYTPENGAGELQHVCAQTDGGLLENRWSGTVTSFWNPTGQ
jgi:hypothetical protein